MFNLKTKFETWIKRLIAEEVGQIETSLQVERAAFACQVRSFKAQFDNVLERLIAQSNPHKENRELRTTLREMEADVTVVRGLLSKLHPNVKF